jgi:carbamoylphosphate synthase large subunit
VIDTEAGRMLADRSSYADEFEFDYASPTSRRSRRRRYAEAIEAADEAGYPVIVVDSASHEHAGDGGLLDMQEAEFERMGRRRATR